MATEKRLIDAYALIADIEKRYCKPCKAEGKDYHEVACRACWVDDMRLEIEAAPTVDAVEVVRCKDCRCNGACSIQDAMNWTPRTEIGDYFCSYGERREGE